MAYVLGDNIDTDQILTAEYLKINPSSAEGCAQLASLAMCGLPEGSLPFIDPAVGKSRYSIVVAGQNFGCGSSREHAVVALGAAGVQAVVAQSYARIFFRNCVSTGRLLPVASKVRLCDRIKTGDIVELRIDEQLVRIGDGDATVPIEPVGELANIVDAGGLFAYARAVGKIAVRAAEGA
ncbi:3-isopropylmalate dehydratase [Burkholderia sp. Bp8998]|uniref:LeuD/DmdB family oxidoreductase small subunit n=1 Tax=Burkholderia sp. Bp8998 TaxID=2184557 RepID=UPI0021AB1B31|nr:3-isopropylmalate dehydratase [Burkholderia sp. Bp8998]